LGDLRHHGGRIFEENRIRSPVASSTRLSFTRGAVTSTGPAAVVTVMAVADHQSAPGHVRLGSQLSYAPVDFGLQCGRKHPARALADDLVDQGAGLGRTVGVHYAEHRACLPDPRCERGPTR
jgi:hypothetical protein